MKKIICLAAIILIFPAMTFAADGDGGASISPPSVATAGVYGIWCVTYNTGSTLILPKTPDGAIAVEIPWNWTTPTTTVNAAGQVTVVAAGVTLTGPDDVIINGNIITVNPPTTVTGGQPVQVYYGNTGPAQAQVQVQAGSTAVFKVFSRFNIAGKFTALLDANQPKLNIVPAATTRIGFGSASQAVKQSTNSMPIIIRTEDDFGNATSGLCVVIDLTAYSDWAGALTGTSPRTSGIFKNEQGSTITSISTPTSGSTMVFYNDSAVGKAILKIHITTPFNCTSFQDFSIMATGLSSVSADTGDPAAGSTLVSLTPDNDNAAETAYINFSQDGDMPWRIIIDTDRNLTFDPNIDWHTEGYGQAGQTIRMDWWPRDNNYRILPNGTYGVRIELGSWRSDGSFQSSNIFDESLKINVASGYISGRVLSDTGASLPGVKAETFSTLSWGNDVTDMNGNYCIRGLKDGTYGVRFSKPAFADYTRNNVIVTSGSASGVNATLASGQTIRCILNISDGNSADKDIWSGLDALPTNASGFCAFAPAHFSAGSTLADNGFGDTGSAQFHYYSELMVSPGVYKVRLHPMPGLGVSSWQIAAGSSGTGYDTTNVDASAGATITFNLIKRPSILGNVSLPAGATMHNGIWISTGAISRTTPGVQFWGGAWLAAGLVSGNFEINGVDPGTYDLKSQAEGFSTLVYASNPVSVSTASISGINMGTFSEGKYITGYIVIGAGTSITQPSLWVNAWSPATGTGNGTNVFNISAGCSIPYKITGLAAGTYEIQTWLSGYELLPFANNTRQVTLAAAQACAVQDIVLVPYTGKITGHINLGGSVDFANAKVIVQPKYWHPDIQVAEVTAKGDSSYEVNGLGTDVYLAAAYYTGLESHGGQVAMVKVANGQTLNLDFDLSAPASAITGKITTISKNPKYATMAGVTLAQGMVSFTPYSPMGQPVGAEHKVPIFFDVSTLSYRYLIKSIPAGMYLVSGPTSFGNAGTANGGTTSDPEVISTRYMVNIPSAGTTITGKDIQIDDGFKVSGTINLPELADAMIMVIIYDRSNNYRQRQLWTLQNNKVCYSFEHLMPDKYTVEVYCDNYTIAYQQIEIVNGDLTQSFTLTKGSTVKGKLKDVDADTMITQDNVAVYISNFDIHAEPKPWVEGGVRQALTLCDNSGCRPMLDNSGYFTIPNLKPGTYDIILKSTDSGMKTSSAQNYVPVTISGIVVSDDSSGTITKDLGTISLHRGIAIKGKVKEKLTGNLLPNIIVLARPAVKGSWINGIKTRTDANGEYILTGIGESDRYYDIVAAPYLQGGEDMMMEMMDPGMKYGQMIKKNIDVTLLRDNINFDLARADSGIKGIVVTSDGGSLAMPNTDSDRDTSMPVAMVTLHNEKEPVSDPLGEIQLNTGPDGRFQINGLVPSTYTIKALSKNYSMLSRSGVVVTPASLIDAGTLTVNRGGTIYGTIKRPDGSSCTSMDVDSVVAALPGFTQILFAEITCDAQTKLVSGYRLSGLEPGKGYTVVVIPYSEHGGVPDKMFLAGENISVASVGEEKVLNIVYRPSPPVFVAQVFKKPGNIFALNFFATQGLRNKTEDDNDMTKRIVLKTGTGTVSQSQMSTDRRNLSCVYTPPAGETQFVINVNAYNNNVNPETNTEFFASYDFTFFIGVDGQSTSHVSQLSGGEVTIDGDSSSVTFPMGCFDTSVDSEVKVTMTKVDSSLIGTGAPKLAPAAYPSLSYRLSTEAPQVTRISSYYDVLLEQAKIATGKYAVVTLAYDAAKADTNLLNIYYYDEDKRVYRLENTERTIDDVNHTISVKVNHLSRFVALNRTEAVIGTTSSGYTGTEFLIFNFPNPFNLSAKTVTKVDDSNQTESISGTMFKAAVPSNMSGKIYLTIYNIAGEKVWDNENNPQEVTGGNYYYWPWNGKNNNDTDVASGVYFCVVKFGDIKRVLKLAVVK